VLVVAGGEWQVPLVRKIKELGMVALCSNLYPDSPAFSFADEHLVADVRDKRAVLAFARHHHVDAVVTDQSDIAVPTVAYLCEQLRLPGIGLKVADLFTNKISMREFCLEHAFPSPRFSVCYSLRDAKNAVSELGFPCVVKPPSNQASRGVTKVSHPQSLDSAVAHALENSSDGSIIIEQFIGGVELTVEGLKYYGGHASLAVSRKEHYPHNPMVAARLVYEASSDEIDYSRLCAQHDRLVDTMGLPFGLTHAEYKYYGDRFYLVEVAARGGGTRISSDIVPALSRIDTNGILIRMALGEKIEPARPERSSRVAALDFWEFPPGVVQEIKGLEDVRSMPGVMAAGMTLRPGQSVRAAEDDRLRHGYVIVEAPDLPALKRQLVEIRSKVHIVYDGA
jgi:biotin carboxylase